MLHQLILGRQPWRGWQLLEIGQIRLHFHHVQDGGFVIDYQSQRIMIFSYRRTTRAPSTVDPSPSPATAGSNCLRLRRISHGQPFVSSPKMASFCTLSNTTLLRQEASGPHYRGLETRASVRLQGRLASAAYEFGEDSTHAAMQLTISMWYRSIVARLYDTEDANKSKH